MAGSEGTVRGAFDLDVGPAVRGVRDYRRVAAEADVQTRQLGESMDRAFGADKAAQIHEVSSATKDLSRDTFRARMEVRDQWRGMRRDIEREAAGISSTIAVVRDRMRALGRERATPTIDVDGITKALGQVELLHERINALGRERATPRVAMGGGFSGGGGFAGRVSSGGRRGGGILDFGMSGIRPRNALIGAGLAYAQPLIGGATSLVSSAGAAGLGAGVVGLGGLAPLAAGVAGVMAVAKPAAADLKNVTKQQDAYNKVVRQHGRDSKQATAALHELHRLERVAGPGSGYASQQTRGFTADWRRLTRPARGQFYGLMGDVAQVGRRVAPQLAADTMTSMSAVRGQGTRFARFLGGTEPQQALTTFSNAFARELPTAERTLEDLTLVMERLARASLPFFHEANVWVEHQADGWRRSTHDVEHVQDEMRPLVQSAKDWGRLTGDTFKLLRDIGQLGRPSGDSLVVDLDRTITRWDDWIHRHPEQVHRFFDDTANSVRHVAKALGSVAGLLNQLATLVRPLGDEFAQLVTLASSLGLIGTPGAGAALYGAFRGGRGGRGGVAAGGGAGGAAAGAGGLFPLLGASRAASGAAAGARVFGGGAAAAQTRAGSLIYGAGFRYGAPVSMTAGEPGLIGRGAGMARGAFGGAVRGAAPIVLGMAALQAASTPGTLGERAQGAASMLSFGLVPGPTTRAMARAQGSDLASADIQRLGPASTVAGIRGQIARLQHASRHYAGMTHADDVGGLFGGTSPIAASFRIGGHDQHVTQADARRNAARVGEYAKRIRELRQAEADLHRERGRELDSLSKQRAVQYGAGLNKAFNVYRRAGESPQAAAGDTVAQIRDRLSKTRNAGVETLGEASLAWARELKKRNPALAKTVDDVTRDIEARFKAMGKRVRIVNGDILTGSKSEWKQISDAMSGPVEQAKERMSADFTAIQQKAVASLRAMGFGPSEARSIVQGLEPGAPRSSRVAARQMQTMGPGHYSTAQQTGTEAARGHARGGMIGGAGLMDTVGVPGGVAAPGEAWIANRHTLARMSMATREKFGLTAEQMIRGETRPHWSPQAFARGGPSMSAAGALSGVNAAVSNIAQAAMSAFPDLVVTSTTGGGHARNSLHYRGAAVDLAGGNMNAAAAWIGRHYGHRLTEGIHNPNLSIAGGQRVPPSHWGASTWAEHANHIHVGMLGGGGARGGFATGGGSVGHVHLSGLGLQQPGVPGHLRQRAGDAYARGLQRRINRHLDAAGGGDLSGFSGGGDAAANMALGRRMMRAAGFGDSEWPALKKLWTRESGWSTSARNPTSGAQGIPQALGHGDIGSSAAAQIAWGLNYISGRYGSPSGAWAHEQSAGWYARGGRMKWAGAFDRGGSFVTDGPTAFVAGEGPRRRRERVTVTPARSGGGGGGHGGITFGPGSVVVQVGGQLTEREAEKVGELVVKKIIAAIDRGTATGVIG